MLRSYLKVALRNMRRSKAYSLINILGLAAGMTCALLISIWVLDELRFDRFHSGAPDLYRVEEDQDYSGRNFHVWVTPYPLAPALKAEVPEISDATRVAFTGGRLFRAGENVFFENRVAAVDPAFLRMFDFAILKGGRDALDRPGSLALTRDLAVKYFGTVDAVGRAVTIDGKDSLTVTAVLENVRHDSSVTFQALVPYAYAETIFRARFGSGIDRFDNNSVPTYVRLRPGASAAAVGAKIKGFIKARVAQSSLDLVLMPLTKIHLYGYFGFDRGLGAIGYVWIFGLIAAFVLLIACINFMNLATARSARRAREVGLRKTSGATRAYLVRQFLGESTVFAAAALALAVLATTLLLPPFGRLAMKTLSWRVAGTLPLLGGLLALTALVGIVAGSYPALYLSSFHPARVLKGRSPSSRGPARFRRTLVVVQFGLTVLLLVGTAVVTGQLRYMQAKKLGWDRQNLIYLPLRGQTGAAYPALRAELARDRHVVAVSGGTSLPSSVGSNAGGATWDGKDPAFQPLVSMDWVDYDYLATAGMTMAEGRGFTREFPGDAGTAFVVNEELARIMGKRPTVGERFVFQGIDGRIVGVVKDFHFESVRTRIEPLAFMLVPGQARNVIVRLAAGNGPEALAAVEAAWRRAVPGAPFEFHFFDEELDRMYRGERQIGVLLGWFSALAVVIACLGLFGLASFTAEQRTREIGIRKVLGASVPGIVRMMCSESLRLVLLANAIAWPAGWLIMGRWLRTFAYRSSLGPGPFATALGIALAVALLSVGTQALRAGHTDPAVAVRFE